MCSVLWVNWCVLMLNIEWNMFLFLITHFLFWYTVYCVVGLLVLCNLLYVIANYCKLWVWLIVMYFCFVMSRAFDAGLCMFCCAVVSLLCFIMCCCVLLLCCVIILCTMAYCCALCWVLWCVGCYVLVLNIVIKVGIQCRGSIYRNSMEQSKYKIPWEYISKFIIS